MEWISFSQITTSTKTTKFSDSLCPLFPYMTPQGISTMALSCQKTLGNAVSQITLVLLFGRDHFPKNAGPALAQWTVT